MGIEEAKKQITKLIEKYERIKNKGEIKKTDAEIDELVYKIYGITEEERKIIEKSLEG